MSERFLLGSGFYGGQKEREFGVVWGTCLTKHCSTIPEKVVILAVGGSEPYGRVLGCDQWPKEEIVHLKGNLGHIGQVMSGEKPHLMCGWSGALLWLAMTAYNGELDLCFVEQDVLAFGDWFGKMMEDLGDGQMIFGHKHEAEPWMWAEQSIIYIRHAWIPLFVMEYIKLGGEADEDLIPETKFRRIEMLYPKDIRRLSFGPGRVRPIPFDDPIFYAQKYSEDDMAEINLRGLL